MNDQINEIAYQRLYRKKLRPLPDSQPSHLTIIAHKSILYKYFELVPFFFNVFNALVRNHQAFVILIFI